MLRTKLLIAITCALTASLTICSSAFSGGTGSATDPYKISVADDLYELSELSDGEIVKISSDLKNGGKVVFDEMSQKLFEWSKRLINETEK